MHTTYCVQQKADLLSNVLETTESAPESMVLTTECQRVNGVCVFRPFKQTKGRKVPFIELVFLVVSESAKFSGVGSTLLERLFQYQQHNGFRYLVTYADNGAVRFFEKNLFLCREEAKSRMLAWLHTRHYYDYVKHYSGSVIM